MEVATIAMGHSPDSRTVLYGKTSKRRREVERTVCPLTGGSVSHQRNAYVATGLLQWSSEGNGIMPR